MLADNLLGVHRRAGFQIMVIAVVSMAAIGTAAAGERCKPLTGANASVDKFIDEVYALQASGEGSLPITDALIGFDQLSATDRLDLGQRDPIKVTPEEEAQGTFVNQGPKPVSITGNVANSSTFFDIPTEVRGSYISTRDSLTLIYDPAYAVKVGESFLGMKVSRTLNHTIITRSRVSYFFDTNTGSKPDRCYTLVDN